VKSRSLRPLPGSEVGVSVLLRQAYGFEGFLLGRVVSPPDTFAVMPSQGLPELIDDWRRAGSAMCPAADVTESHISEVPQFLDLDPVVGKGGLRVEGRLDLAESAVAREAWRSLKAGRVGLSFGFLATESRPRKGGGRELLELDVYEVSLTPSPMNSATRILAAKAITNAVTTEELRRRCEALGISTHREKSGDRRPVQVRSFDA
jgi:hypothetical protein